MHTLEGTWGETEFTQGGLAGPFDMRGRVCVCAWRGGVLVLGLLAAFAFPGRAQEPSPLGWDPYLTFAGNFDVGYRNTQFFQPNYNTIVGQWDSRVEVWLPPSRRTFAWGPYVRATGIAGSRADAFQNAWVGKPGVGFQMYPFSLPRLRQSSSKAAKNTWAAPPFCRIQLAELLGCENSWRPHKQTRYGAEHWRSLHANDFQSAWWAETWNGLWWQSANEFDPHYRSTIFANSARFGLRAPRHGAVSAVTPYVAAESSVTGNDSYYWENKLVAGGGFRITPPLRGRFQQETRINRLALYAEYLHVVTYYRDIASHQAALSGVPAHEVRIGLTFSTGLWYY